MKLEKLECCVLRSLLVLMALAVLACDATDQPNTGLPTQVIWLHQGQQQTGDWVGQWLLVNYWAIWCKPCIKEIPELNELHTVVPGLQVLGVNYDQPNLVELERQANQLTIAFPLLLSDPELLGLRMPSVLPTSYLINPDGKVVKTLLGPQTKASVRKAMTEAGF